MMRLKLNLLEIMHIIQGHKSTISTYFIRYCTGFFYVQAITVHMMFILYIYLLIIYPDSTYILDI